MVLRTKDIIPRITLETYVSYPSLKRVAIPLASSKNGEAIGLIPKIKNLDPIVAKSYIFIEPKIIERTHSVFDPKKEKYKSLLSQESIKNLKEFFKPVDKLISDEKFLYATRKGGTSKFLERVEKGGLLRWQSMVLQNGGWIVKPHLLLKDFEGYKDENGFTITKEDMKKINPCKYYNEEGIDISKSNFDDFVRVFDLDITTKENRNYYKKIFDSIRSSSDSLDDPLSLNTLQDLISRKIGINESKRIELLKKLTGYNKDYIEKNFTIDKWDNKKGRNVANKLIRRIRVFHEISSEKKREKACKLVTVLNDLQERKGWHNRVTPLESVDTPEKAHYFLNGENINYLSDHLKLAEESIKETINLLKICENNDDPSSCIHPSDKKNIGLYGRNKDNVYDQKSWIEPSEEMRAYALIDVPLFFYKSSVNNDGFVNLVSKLKKGIKIAGKDHYDSLYNVHSFETLSRLGDITGLPFTDPKRNVIHFAPDAIIDNSKRKRTSEEIRDAIMKYYEGEDDTIVVNKLRGFKPITFTEIKKNKKIYESPITESMVYPHQLLTHPKNVGTGEFHDGCLNTVLPVEKGGIRISTGDLVLLDGKNHLIRWKSPSGKRKTIKEVYNEIMENSGGDEERADPSKWKWVCIKDQSLQSPEEVSSKKKNTKFKLKKIISRRAVDLYYRKEGDNVKISVNEDSIANAMKDIAIMAYNAINLGAITQMPGYVENNNNVLLKQSTDWEEIKKGGDPKKRLAIQELKKTVDNIQKEFKTEKQFNIIKDLVSKERTINANTLWFDPKSRILLQRRKNIAKNKYGIPDDLFVDPIKKTRDEREKAKNDAVLALETNLSDVFSYVGVTPKRRK